VPLLDAAVEGADAGGDQQDTGEFPYPFLAVEEQVGGKQDDDEVEEFAEAGDRRCGYAAGVGVEHFHDVVEQEYDEILHEGYSGEGVQLVAEEDTGEHQAEEAAERQDIVECANGEESMEEEAIEEIDPESEDEVEVKTEFGVGKKNGHQQDRDEQDEEGDPGSDIG